MTDLIKPSCLDGKCLFTSKSFDVFQEANRIFVQFDECSLFGKIFVFTNAYNIQVTFTNILHLTAIFVPSHL